VVVLITLIALTIILFGIAATDGPLQVALFLSAAFASLVAFKNGYTSAEVADAAVGGVTSAMGAIFILLAVGARGMHLNTEAQRRARTVDMRIDRPA
jgi:NhaC family Na+:H+ antiporter